MTPLKTQKYPKKFDVFFEKSFRKIFSVRPTFKKIFKFSLNVATNGWYYMILAKKKKKKKNPPNLEKLGRLRP